MLHRCSAGVGSALPARSDALARNTCGPRASAAYVIPDAQSAKSPPSREHAKVAGSSAAMSKVAELSAVSAGGAETIVVSGGFVSIRNGPMWDVPLQFPPTSRARRWNHQEPSGRTDERLVVVSSTSFAVSGCVSALADHSYE